MPLSPKPLLSKAQRIVSYAVWGRWLMMFLERELSGNLRFVPWRTFSEAVWDFEKHRPGTRRYILAFALALADHIRFRTELRDSWTWALEHVDAFQDWLVAQDGE